MQTIIFKQDRRPAGALKPIKVSQNEAINYSYYTGTNEVIGKPEVKAKAKPKTRQRQRQLPFQR